MNLIGLRDDDFVQRNWTRLRPFYSRLSPEMNWQEVRRQIVEELKEEIQANESHTWEYATYFTYPTDEQLTFLHKAGEQSGLFFSEIREIVAFRSAEALSTLAGLIRLEPEGHDRILLEESFANLWHQFSQHGYGHGYDTANTRATLILTLASNNTFDLIDNRDWVNGMREYFLTDVHPWSQRPLPEAFPEVLQALGETVNDTQGDRDHPCVSRVFDLASGNHNLKDIQKDLHWEQGRPEDFNTAEPRSVFYQIPYHLVKFVGVQNLPGQMETRRGRLPGHVEARHEPFAKSVLHFLTSLCLRTKLASTRGLGPTFTLTQAAEVCGGDAYAAMTTLGQMIKVGLAKCDPSMSWSVPSQQFSWTTATESIV
ncbi:hypothetical protein AYO44_07510 [Planctomycetaceae bacterium SCGC AG-212-F19]|nr:hypothetical protein AYO44_07510 [Planctomycetaceae bacterium SCGC AG-212-F19]